MIANLRILKKWAFYEIALDLQRKRAASLAQNKSLLSGVAISVVSDSHTYIHTGTETRAAAGTGTGAEEERKEGRKIL